MTKSTSIWPLLGLFLLASCTSYGHYRFRPSPLTLALEEGGLSTDVLITALGIEALETDGDEELLMSFRLRVENGGSAVVAVDPAEFRLVDADLREFEAAQVVSETGAFEVPPGASRSFGVSFPFPDDARPRDMNLDGLDLRGVVQYAAGSATFHANFERAVRPAYRYDSFNFGLGWGPYPYSWYGPYCPPRFYYGGRGYWP